MQKAVARKFRTRRRSRRSSTSLANPAVNLLPDQNRVAVQLDAHFVSCSCVRPSAASSPCRASLRRAEPLGQRRRVDSLALDGDAQMRAAGAGRLLATQLLTNYPIYTFKPEQHLPG